MGRLVRALVRRLLERRPPPLPTIDGSRWLDAQIADHRRRAREQEHLLFMRGLR